MTVSRKNSDQQRKSPANLARNVQFGVYAPLKNPSDFFHRTKRNVLDGVPPVSDAQCVQDLMRIGVAADQHGFDAIWFPEQHGDAAAMGASPLTLLVHLASLTKSIELGAIFGASLIESPVRVAERIATADVLLRGRPLNVAAFSNPLYHEVLTAPESDVTEPRRKEAIAFLELLLTQEWACFEGSFYSQKDISIRPMPLTKFEEGFVSLWGNGTDDSDRCTVVSGFDVTDKEAGNGAGKTILVPIFCSLDAKACDRAKSWWIQEFDSEIWHSGVFSHPSTRDIPRTASPREVSLAINNAFSKAEELLVAGNPEECRAEIEKLVATTSCHKIVFQVHFGLMPVELAEESLELLSAELRGLTVQPKGSQ